MLYIGSDHGGYDLKEDIKKFLDLHSLKYVDVGPKDLDPQDDYPKFSADLGREVAKDPESNRGILMCRSGQGVCIVANKIRGIRAATAWNEKVAEASVKDDNANVLCLPSDYISTEAAEGIVLAWLNTQFSGEERHRRRLAEIESLE
jgi:RpiB/LacA/LacB family sugar-phosphate isomerase